MERLSVSLNEKSLSIIKKYLSKYNTSQADIIRRSLSCLDTIEEATEKTQLDSILTYVDYLANKEHLIIDIAHWKSIFIEIGDGSKKFWDEVYKIGDAHRKEYFDKGIREVKQVLEYIEKTNWYKLNAGSKSSFTLVLAAAESAKFIRTFFEGFFSKYPQKVEIKEEYMKIRIVVH
ncbi:MAG: hypothetical protein U9O49_01105 [Candidatus Thermoplasmatota archaeon]|nr:hypothetical protein [Candidatus Thermoplasmatota archaeon]